MKHDKTEPSLGRKILSRLVLYSLITVCMFIGMAHWNAMKYPVDPPMLDRTSLYKQAYSFGPAFPFYYKYYLFTPQNYNPAKEYPLVLLLHGVSRHMHGGKFILDSGAQSKYQAFVVIPIAPAGMTWATLNQTDRPAQSLAMDAVKEVQKKYSIDPKRLYVSGYSMGGVGTFGMIEKYPDVFAAALPLCGYWPPQRASLFPDNVPVLALHGQRDGPEASRNIVGALNAQRKKAHFSEYPNIGHDVWNYAYPDIRIWDWLFAQKKT